MELNLIDYVNKEKDVLKHKVEYLKSKGIQPKLNIFTDNKDFASQSYMKSKINIGSEIGVDVIKTEIKNLSELMMKTTQSVINNECIILQQPFQNEKITELYKSLKPRNDVDGFFKYQDISEGTYNMSHCTAHGMFDYILHYFDGDIRNKNIILVGRGELTNKPLSLMLINEGATVAIINSKTSEDFKKTVFKIADCVVCSTSVKGSVKTSDLSDDKKVLVINCGIVRDTNGKLDTELEIDVDKPNVDYTPRIKGVGQLTTLYLFKNILNYYMQEGDSY